MLERTKPEMQREAQRLGGKIKIKNDESVGWREQHQKCRVKLRNLAGKLRLKMMNLYAGKNNTIDVE